MGTLKELTEYDEQLHAEGEAEFRDWAAWVDDLTDDEFCELQQQSTAAGAGEDLGTEIGRYLAHPHHARPSQVRY